MSQDISRARQIDLPTTPLSSYAPRATHHSLPPHLFQFQDAAADKQHAARFHTLSFSITQLERMLPVILFKAQILIKSKKVCKIKFH